MITDYSPGQVWEVMTQAGRVWKVLIVGVQDTFANTIQVWEEGENAHTTVLRGGGSVDTRRVAWTGLNDLSNYSYSIDHDELDDILGKVRQIFGGVTSENEPSTAMDFLRRERDIYREMCFRLCGDRR